MLNGRRDNTSMYYQGTYGYYWSSTAYSDATYVYRLYLESSGGVYPANLSYKYYGYPLRCLAEGRKGNSLSTHTIYQLLTDSTGPNLVLRGFRRSTSMISQGTSGNYWSSTASSSATDAYFLGLISDGRVFPANYNPKYYGYSLRCLAEVAKSNYDRN